MASRRPAAVVLTEQLAGLFLFFSLDGFRAHLMIIVSSNSFLSLAFAVLV